MKSFVRFASATTFAALLALAGSAGALPPADDDLEIDGTIRTGVRYLDLTGDEAKFNEYRAVDNGLGVTLEEVILRGYKGPYHFLLEGQDLDREDRLAVMEGGRYGKYNLRLGWNQIPHHFAENAPFLGSLQGDSYWAFPDSVRKALLDPEFPLGYVDLDDPGGRGCNYSASKPGDDPLAAQCSPTATGRANLLDLLDHAGRLDLKVEREIGTVDISYTFFENFEARVNYLHENRDGFRAMSAGAYLRDSQGASNSGAGLGEDFTLFGLEFPEPIDYKTDQLTFGLNYRQDSWHVDFAYRFVNFDNTIDHVTWDNPLLLDGGDADGDGFPGVDNVPGGAALNRLNLFPSSMSHSLSFTAGIWDLPWNSRFTTTASWTRITQDDAFPAYTVNESLTVRVPGNPFDGERAVNVPLAAHDLDGQVDTLLVNAVISSRPIDPLSLNLKVNYYEYGNESDQISWTEGWARIGESRWSKSGETGVVNRVPDWDRVRSSVDASWRFNKRTTLLADYTYEMYNRNNDRNADTNEHIVGGRIKLRPVDWATLRAGYHWSDRKIDGGYSPYPAHEFFEWEELRMFDQADRTRHRADAYLGVDPIDRLSLGFAFKYRNDEYDKSYYGLQERDGYTTGVDASYVFSDRASIFAYYSRDDYDSDSKIRAKTNEEGGGEFDDFPPGPGTANDFVTAISDITNTVGGTVSIGLIPEKLTLDVGADYSYAKTKFNNSNPNFVSGAPSPENTTSSATAYDWEDVKSKTTQVRAELNYHWTERLSTGFRYLYERYKLEDLMTDSVVPYGISPDTQGNALDYFIFMDANYSNYRAHLLSFTVSYTF
jgi:MtrB/PioB family decaheme-associated outer membrane protein